MLQVDCDWFAIGTAKEIEENLVFNDISCFEISGPGFYLSDTATVLVLTVSYNKHIWEVKHTPTTKYEAHIWECVYADTIFSQLANVPTAIDLRKRYKGKRQT